MNIKTFPSEIEKLGRDERVADALGEVAEKVQSRVRAPSRFRITHRRGVSKRGAFAQVVMTDTQWPSAPRSGAIAVEFGTRYTRPLAPLRNALRSVG